MSSQPNASEAYLERKIPAMEHIIGPVLRGILSPPGSSALTGGNSVDVGGSGDPAVAALVVRNAVETLLVQRVGVRRRWLLATAPAPGSHPVPLDEQEVWEVVQTLTANAARVLQLARALPEPAHRPLLDLLSHALSIAGVVSPDALLAHRRALAPRAATGGAAVPSAVLPSVLDLPAGTYGAGNSTLQLVLETAGDLDAGQAPLAHWFNDALFLAGAGAEGQHVAPAAASPAPSRLPSTAAVGPFSPYPPVAGQRAAGATGGPAAAGPGTPSQQLQQQPQGRYSSLSSNVMAAVQRAAGVGPFGPSSSSPAAGGPAQLFSPSAAAAAAAIWGGSSGRKRDRDEGQEQPAEGGPEPPAARQAKAQRTGGGGAHAQQSNGPAEPSDIDVAVARCRMTSAALAAIHGLWTDAVPRSLAAVESLTAATEQLAALRQRALTAAEHARRQAAASAAQRAGLQAEVERIIHGEVARRGSAGGSGGAAAASSVVAITLELSRGPRAHPEVVELQRRLDALSAAQDGSSHDPQRLSQGQADAASALQEVFHGLEALIAAYLRAVRAALIDAWARYGGGLDGAFAGLLAAVSRGLVEEGRRAPAMRKDLEDHLRRLSDHDRVYGASAPTLRATLLIAQQEVHNALSSSLATQKQLPARLVQAVEGICGQLSRTDLTGGGAQSPQQGQGAQGQEEAPPLPTEELARALQERLRLLLLLQPPSPTGASNGTSSSGPSSASSAAATHATPLLEGLALDPGVTRALGRFPSTQVAALFSAPLLALAVYATTVLPPGAPNGGAGTMGLEEEVGVAANDLALGVASVLRRGPFPSLGWVMPEAPGPRPVAASSSNGAWAGDALGVDAPATPAEVASAVAALRPAALECAQRIGSALSSHVVPPSGALASLTLGYGALGDPALILSPKDPNRGGPAHVYALFSWGDWDAWGVRGEGQLLGRCVALDGGGESEHGAEGGEGRHPSSASAVAGRLGHRTAAAASAAGAAGVIGPEDFAPEDGDDDNAIVPLLEEEEEGDIVEVTQAPGSAAAAAAGAPSFRPVGTAPRSPFSPAPLSGSSPAAPASRPPVVSVSYDRAAGGGGGLLASMLGYAPPPLHPQQQLSPRDYVGEEAEEGVVSQEEQRQIDIATKLSLESSQQHGNGHGTAAAGVGGSEGRQRSVPSLSGGKQADPAPEEGEGTEGEGEGTNGCCVQ